jgi:hypothetical protein
VGDEVYLAHPGEEDLATIEKRTPEIRRLLPEVALVSSGISPGELIVVTNLEQVADGSTVILVRDEHRPGGSGR